MTTITLEIPGPTGPEQPMPAPGGPEVPDPAPPEAPELPDTDVPGPDPEIPDDPDTNGDHDG